MHQSIAFRCCPSRSSRFHEVIRVVHYFVQSKIPGWGDSTVGAVFNGTAIGAFMTKFKIHFQQLYSRIHSVLSWRTYKIKRWRVCPARSNKHLLKIIPSRHHFLARRSQQNCMLCGCCCVKLPPPRLVVDVAVWTKIESTNAPYCATYEPAISHNGGYGDTSPTSHKFFSAPMYLSCFPLV